MRSRPTRTLAVLAGLCLALGLGGAARPAAAPGVRALLIGVQDYPGLPAALRLEAPVSDAQRLRAALIGAGLDGDAIELMTETAGTRPTRSAVLAALSRLADTARPGDRIMVYFSGHGGQAPARRPGREPDGLEELYLAADATRWDGRRGRVPGSIADFEMEAALAAIEAKGADVWFVADACHAGGLTRSGLSSGDRPKSVSTAALGVPASRAALRASSRERSPLGSGGGRFTGFYAAAPGQLAVERRLAGGTRASVFSWALVRALAQGRFRSYRDLALALASGGGDTAAAAPAPVFEGSLDGSVMGLAPRARLLPVVRDARGLGVSAGAPEGFEPGALVELTSPDGTLAARAEVSQADLSGARLVADRPPPPGPLYARVIRAPGAGGSRGRRLLGAVELLAGRGMAASVAVESQLWRGGCGPNPPARLGPPAGAEPFDPLQPPVFRHCDVVYLSIANHGAETLDLSPLYVDAAGEVAALSLAPEDEVRLKPGETRWAAVRLLTRSTDGRPLPHGTERLVLIAAPAKPGARSDFRSLAGPAAYRGGPAAPDPSPALGALVYPWRVED
jgi:uncharacterized caspase-like protein